MEILVKGFTNNAGTYGNMCSCDCDCNCNAVGMDLPGIQDQIQCARKNAYQWTGCTRYTPRG